jgi:hypothetical protein
LSLPGDVAPTAPPLASREPMVTRIAPPADNTSQASPSNADRLPALLSRLEKFGVSDRKLTTWGSSGHLYRFCCSAPLGDSPAITQHFESVAADQEVAVEQVLAKVEAWRTAQRGTAMLR